MSVDVRSREYHNTDVHFKKEYLNENAYWKV